MSDAKDAVAEARAQNQRHAASCAARKEALAAEVTSLEAKRASAAELLQAAAGGATRDEAEELVAAIDERLAARRTELAAAAYDLEAALTELRALDRLRGTAARADAQAIAADVLGGDPLIRSAEEIALDNARGHIADLDARVRLDAELAPEAPATATAPTPASPAPGAMSDDEARQRFEELRARLGKGAPPKKTL